MSERRQAFRRDPIEVELESDRVISVGPVPWEDRNKVGDEIIRQHTEELNDAVKLFVAEDGETPQLAARLANKLKDPFTVLHLALDKEAYEKIVDRKLYPNQLTALLLAVIEVNELMHLQPLVDPNAPTPTGIGGMLEALTLPTEPETPKTVSGPDSSLGVSAETPSEPLPTPSLVGS